MKNVVVYYSGKGSNRVLAGKTAEALGCDKIELKPRVNGLVMPATALKLSFGIKPLSMNFSDYDSIVLCGPVYMGNIAAPCKDFIRKYGKSVKKINFITCCGSSDEKKDEKFGYARVFSDLNDSIGEKLGVCEAFPVGLLLSEEQRNDDEAMMNTRMNENNFIGEVKDRLERFAGKLK